MEIILIVEEHEALMVPDVHFWLEKVRGLKGQLLCAWESNDTQAMQELRPQIVNARAQLELALEAEAIADGRA